ncbi:hypothetical protein [Agathobaculum desmolans]|uniref:hypothetical protein n=1 Tax=Agathobaculum desmolans TaxID=39484 RepID=UPI00248E8597|nr:hypothetical protein [Agathobaculum desmolans]
MTDAEFLTELKERGIYAAVVKALENDQLVVPMSKHQVVYRVGDVQTRPVTCDSVHIYGVEACFLTPELAPELGETVFLSSDEAFWKKIKSMKEEK